MAMSHEQVTEHVLLHVTGHRSQVTGVRSSFPPGAAPGGKLQGCGGRKAGAECT